MGKGWVPVILPSPFLVFQFLFLAKKDMTKANYMALADLQTVWNNKMKPHIQQTYAAASHNHTKSQITDFAHTHTKSDITDYDNPEAAFVGETLVLG